MQIKKKIELCGQFLYIETLERSLRGFSRGAAGLAAARSPRCSWLPPAANSLPLGRFATPFAVFLSMVSYWSKDISGEDCAFDTAPSIDIAFDNYHTALGSKQEPDRYFKELFEISPLGMERFFL